MNKEELEQLNQAQYALITTLLIQVKDLTNKIEHLEKLLMHEPKIIMFPHRKQE